MRKRRRGNVGVIFREVVKELFHWVWEGNIVIIINNYDLRWSRKNIHVIKLALAKASSASWASPGHWEVKEMEVRTMILYA